MEQTKKIMGITSLILGLFSLAVTAVFMLNYPIATTEFNLESFRLEFSGFPPTLPFVLAAIVAAMASCHSGYGKPAICLSTISAGVMYMLFLA